MKAVRWRALFGLVGAIVFASASSGVADNRAAHSIANKFAEDSVDAAAPREHDRDALERKLQDEERLRADERDMLERAKAEAGERKAADAEAKRRAVEQDEEAKRLADDKRKADEADDRAARDRAAREAALIREAEARRKADEDRAKAVAEKAEADAAAKRAADLKAAEAKAAAVAQTKAEADAKAKAEAEARAKAQAEADAVAAAKAAADKADAEKREIAAAKARIDEARRADEQRRKADAEAAEQRRVAAEREQAKAAEMAAAQRKMEAEREAEARQLSEKLARARELREARGQSDNAGQGFSALGGPPVQSEPEESSRSRSRLQDTRPRAGEVPVTETRATILLVMEPGTRGIRRYEKTADPVVCIGAQCFVSNGLDVAASAMTRARALGPGNTLGQRAGACRHTLVCAFRDVEVGSGLVQVQPVDMRILRHDRREAKMLKIDPSCAVVRGQLRCDRGLDSGSYRVWIVPESVARRAGPDGLSAALAADLPSDDRTARSFDR